MTILIVGEQRSLTARRMKVWWEDEALAAKPLFAALRACCIDPTLDCVFVNWFDQDKWTVRRHSSGPILALGKLVQRALTEEGIPYIPLIHPAARGKIRLRANYIAHVVAQLAQLKRPPGGRP